MVSWSLFAKEPWEKEDGFMALRNLFGKKANKPLTVKVPEPPTDKDKVQEVTNFLLHGLKEAPHMLLSFLDPNTSKVLVKDKAFTDQLRQNIDMVISGSLKLEVSIGADANPGNMMNFNRDQMRNGFLNNAIINCCFFTTYAEVLGCMLKKSTSWFSFVNPTIGSSISPVETDSSRTSTSGYDTGSLGTENSLSSSPIPHPVFRPFGRITQRQRREMEKEAREAMKLQQVQAAAVPCPANHEIKSVPSKFYSFESILSKTWLPTWSVGMQPKTETVKVEPPKPFRVVKVDRRRRAGNNRRRVSPRPVLPPRKKEPVIIDEDGFQLVTGKKAARIPTPPAPAPVVVEKEAPKKRKRVKKPKRYSMVPTKAMILHDMKQAPYEPPVVEEKPEEEEIEEVLIVKAPKKVVKAPKKNTKPFKKEVDDIVAISAKIQAENGIPVVVKQKKKAEKRRHSKLMIVFAVMLFCLILFGLMRQMFKEQDVAIVVEKPVLKMEFIEPNFECLDSNLSFGSFKSCIKH